MRTPGLEEVTYRTLAVQRDTIRRQFDRKMRETPKARHKVTLRKRGTREQTTVATWGCSATAERRATKKEGPSPRKTRVPTRAASPSAEQPQTHRVGAIRPGQTQRQTSTQRDV